MKKNLITKFLIFLSINLFSQNYFQQEVNYDIDVTLDDQNHVLTGKEMIEYINNSPDNLDVLWFHIWPNAYKDNTTALAKQKLSNGNFDLQNATQEEIGYISNLNFTINDEEADWEYHPEHIDICKIILNEPIKTGESIIIKTPFKVKIPDAKFSRLGHIDQSYMITQWYPKPAVYDKEGWHIIPYLDQGEFYSEFGTFDVKITLPKNYIVGATGNLQNQDELRELEELAKKTISTNIGLEKDMSFPKSSEKMKTLRYVQHKVHDFAWFADKRYHVLKGEVELPYSKRKVTLYTMFTDNESKLWQNSIEYMHDAVYYYSLWNGDYPYEYCTAVDGTISAGGGMEYPNITVIGTSENAKALEEVIMHEVGHNWFYGILGTNERDHAWMDEGINSFDELRYMKTKYPDYNMILDLLPNRIVKVLDLENYTNKQIIGELPYMMSAWNAKDQPIDFPSSKYTPMNYGGIVYMKTAIVFDYLMAYLGEDLFDICMKKYYEKWKFKHPQPEDLQEVFEKESNKELSWFFKNMITTTNQLDYAISSIKKDKSILYITLKNNGEIPGPLVICGVKDGIPNNELWIEGFEGEREIKYLNENYDYIRIDYHGVMPETNRNNNIYKMKGLFKKFEPIKLQLIGSLDHPEKTQIFYVPKIDWNKYNKTSFGLSFYNQLFPKGGVSYRLSPMYSFFTEELIGTGEFSFSRYSHKSIFSKFNISISVEKFNYTNDFNYNRICPSIEMILNQYNLRSKKLHKFKTSLIVLNKDGFSRNLDMNFNPGDFDIEENKKFLNMEYSFLNNNTINPYNIKLNLEKGEDFTKVNIILNYNYQFNKNKKISSRFYTGIADIDAGHNKYAIQMSAWNGSMDYTFSENSFSREQNGRLSRQMFINEGGLKHYTNYTSEDFLSTLSIDFTPHKNIHMYTEIGTDFQKYFFGTGIIFKISGMKIYIPLYTDNGIFNGEKYYNNIRLELQSIQLNMPL